MKFYVLIDGKLVAATPAQIFNKAIQLFDEAGAPVARPEEAAPAPAPAAPVEDPIVTLSAAVNALTTKVEGVAGLKTAVDDLTARFQTRAAATFPLPTGDGTIDTTVMDGKKEVMGYVAKHYDRNYQATDKGAYPFWKPAEKTVDELFMYFGLLARIGRKYPDPVAMQLFEKHYGSIKTAVGDAGNVFPIPDIVDAEILAFAREKSVILSQGRMVPMTSEKQSFPQETGSASVAWGNTTSESEPGISEVELTATELSVYSAVKNMTLADSRSDIVGWLTANLGEAAAQELDNKAWNGVGTDNPFIVSGILSAACGFSVVFGTGSTAFSQVTTTYLSLMIAKLDGLRKQGASFQMNGAVLHFIRDLKDTNGRPIFYEGNIGAGTPPTIFGYPYTEVIKMPATTTANTAFISFGNLRYFLVGRRLDSAALDVDPYGLWTTNRTRFKLYQRWGMAMGLPKGFTRMLTAA
jgi:HK97 family phage major capsid protein